MKLLIDRVYRQAVIFRLLRRIVSIYEIHGRKLSIYRSFRA